MNIERPKKYFVMVLLCTGMVGCVDFSICENTAEKVVFSPNRELKAVIFDRGCGATTGFTTGVSILNSTEGLSHADTGNVLIADGAYQGSSVPANGVNFEVEWKSDTELLVRHAIANHKQSNSVGNVRIRFERTYAE